MTILYSDNFAANIANWINVRGSWSWASGNQSLQSDLGLGSLNSIRVDTAVLAVVADCKVTVKRITGASWDAGPVCRWSGTSGAETGYHLQAVQNDGAIYLVRFDAGTYVGLATFSGLTLAANDTYALQAVTVGGGSGVALAVIQNGTQVGTFTDSSANRVTAAGWCGVATFATAQMNFDDFLVEDASLAASPTLMPMACY